VFVVPVKFILSMLGYIAEVVVQNGAQENGTVEDDCNSVTDEECMDIEMEELMDSTHNVGLLLFHLISLTVMTY